MAYNIAKRGETKRVFKSRVARVNARTKSTSRKIPKTHGTPGAGHEDKLDASLSKLKKTGRKVGSMSNKSFESMVKNVKGRG